MNRVQKKEWVKILLDIKAFNIQSDIELVPFIKELAIGYIDNDNLTISVNNTLLHTFNNIKEKKQFIKSKRKNKAWGTDSILFPYLHALGYRTKLHLSNSGLSAYEVYEPKDKFLRTVHIANYGASVGGIHWELLEHESEQFKPVANKADGDCMYCVLAQAIWKDHKRVKALLQRSRQKKRNNMSKIATKESLQLKEEWDRYEDEDSRVYREIFADLSHNHLHLNHEQYLYLFQSAYKLCDGDAYIMSKMNSIRQFCHLDLLHVLSKEAWRNPKFYNYLVKNKVVKHIKKTRFNIQSLYLYTQLNEQDSLKRHVECTLLSKDQSRVKKQRHAKVIIK